MRGKVFEHFLKVVWEKTGSASEEEEERLYLMLFAQKLIRSGTNKTHEQTRTSGKRSSYSSWCFVGKKKNGPCTGKLEKKRKKKLLPHY